MLVADAGRADVFRTLADGLRPLPPVLVWQWADAKRILTRETSAEYGPWRTGRVPYTREIMLALSSSHPCESVAWMKCSQIAATEVGLNWIGCSIEHDPGPFLLVVPSDPFARRYSKRRIRPLIEACPTLRAIVRPARSRDSGNTTLQKDHPGGSLLLASAQSAAQLASDPVRRVMLDEIDRYPADVSEEGSPIALAETRTTNYPNRKLYFVSSPGSRERSRIEPAFLAGDQRRYFVPCPHCGHMDFITWRGKDPFKTDEREHFSIVWTPGESKTAAMLCPACGCLIEERNKPWMLRDREEGGVAEWRPTAPGDGQHLSYHTPGMYSPLGWLSWARMVREFEKATEAMKRGSRELLQSFVNTRLGECWEETMDKIEKRPLLARAEVYARDEEGKPIPRVVPAGVGVLVASVDVQGDRLEAQVVGYGAGEESWLIDWRQFHGDPESESLWFELDRYLQRSWEHESRRLMPIECAAIDSGGHHSQQVYEFCGVRIDRRVFAIKGGPEMAKPLVGKPTRNNRWNTPLFVLCVDTGKDRVYSRLKVTHRGPGYMHFPAAAWFDEEYVEQLTSERKVPGKWMKGRGSVPYWKKTCERNEALDLTVYALAALYILGADFVESLPEEAERWAQPLEEGEVANRAAADPEEAPAPAPDPGFQVNPFGTSWRTDWRK